MLRGIRQLGGIRRRLLPGWLLIFIVAVFLVVLCSNGVEKERQAREAEAVQQAKEKQEQAERKASEEARMNAEREARQEEERREYARKLEEEWRAYNAWLEQSKADRERVEADLAAGRWPEPISVEPAPPIPGTGGRTPDGNSGGQDRGGGRDRFNIPLVPGD